MARSMVTRIRQSWGLVAIGSLALALRCWYVWRTRNPTDYGFDSRTYFTLASSLVSDHRYVSPYYPGRPRSALFPPGLPVVLAGLRLVGITTYRHAAYALSVIGAMSAITIAVIGRRLYGWRVGATAGALAACYPMFILADGALMSEGVFLLLVCTTLWLCLRAKSSDGFRRWVVVGVPIGAAALTRGEGLLLWPFVAVLAAVLRGGRSRDIVLRSALAGLVPVVLVGAWVVRNQIEVGYPVPIAVSSWTVVGGANCPSTYSGELLGSWDSECLHLAARRTLGEVRGGIASRNEGERYARAHLSRLPIVLAAREGRTFGLYRPFRELHTEALGESRDYTVSKWGYFMYVALVPLAAIGGWLTRRRLGRRTVMLLCGPIAMVFATSLLGYGNQRFRIAAEPTLVLFAAVALAHIPRMVRRGAPT